MIDAKYNVDYFDKFWGNFHQDETTKCFKIKRTLKWLMSKNPLICIGHLMSDPENAVYLTVKMRLESTIKFYTCTNTHIHTPTHLGIFIGWRWNIIGTTQAEWPADVEHIQIDTAIQRLCRITDQVSWKHPFKIFIFYIWNIYFAKWGLDFLAPWIYAHICIYVAYAHAHTHIYIYFNIYIYVIYI